MADKTGEQLSALVDGEGEKTEWELVLRRLAKDADLKARWECYHLVSDAMKNNLPEVVDSSFANRIRKAIDADPHPLRTDSSTPLGFSWYKPVTGLALAASVAAITVLGLRLMEMGDSAEVIPRESVAQLDDEATDSALEARLNAYLRNHNEYASMNGVPGVLPYVRIVGYDVER